MMMKLKIGLDFDDVIAPFNDVAIEMANEKYDIQPPLRLDEITSWNHEDTRAVIIDEFYKDPELYLRQTKLVTEETKACVHRLMEFADVYFITAAFPEFMSTRAMQIKEIFPEFPDNHIILGAAKYLVHFDMTLDDNLDNILNSPSDYPVLMRRPWNQKMTGLLSVNNLREFVELVEHIYNTDKKVTKLSEPSVIALVGPTGSGKNEMVADLHKITDNVVTPVTYTTNPACDNANAHKIVVSDKDFEELECCEKTMYGGYKYGSVKKDVSSILEQGKHVVIPVDICGAIGMKAHFPTVIVYVGKKKEALIREIITSRMTLEEQTLRIMSLDAERKNADIADIVIDNNHSKGAIDLLALLK